MTYRQVFKYYQSMYQIAKTIGISRQAVTRWKKTGKVPKKHQKFIERDTDGQLKADPLILS